MKNRNVAKILKIQQNHVAIKPSATPNKRVNVQITKINPTSFSFIYLLFIYLSICVYLYDQPKETEK